MLHYSKVDRFQYQSCMGGSRIFDGGGGGMSVSVSVAGQEAATPEHFENEDCERRNFWHSTSPHSGKCCSLVNPPHGSVPKLHNSL